MKMVLFISALIGFSAHATVFNCSKSPIKIEPAQLDIRGSTVIYENLRWTIVNRSNVMTNPNTGKRYFLIKLHRPDVDWGPGFSCFIDPI